jgi:hypothetical protein
MGKHWSWYKVKPMSDIKIPLTTPAEDTNLQRPLIQVIGVSGKARAGKDTLFSIAARNGYTWLSFAEELKTRVRRDFPFLTKEHTDGALKEVPLPELSGYSTRDLLIDYGTGLFRKYDNDYWVKAFVAKLKALPADAKVMVTDVRFPNEAEALKSVGGLLLRLERHPDRDSMVSEKTKLSVSETALDDYKGFDYVLPGEHNRVPGDLERFWLCVMDNSTV